MTGEWAWLLQAFAGKYGVRSNYATMTHLRWVLRPGVASVSQECFDLLAHKLRPLMEQSRKEQNEVSTRLAEQVLEALWILLRGFDAAGLEVEDPSHIYGGLTTVLLRLVFLLYAEDEELMPTDSLYGQHYSVGGLAQHAKRSAGGAATRSSGSFASEP